jgi:hypothetical protein
MAHSHSRPDLEEDRQTQVELPTFATPPDFGLDEVTLEHPCVDFDGFSDPPPSSTRASQTTIPDAEDQPPPSGRRPDTVPAPPPDDCGE